MNSEKLSKYSELESLLHKEMPVNLARIKFISLLLVSIVKVQSVNFEKLATGFENPVQLSSNLRRIQRFFASFKFSENLTAQLLFKMLPAMPQYALSLDRTNWQFGKTNINILVLGVIFKGVAFPLLWLFLGDKKGNSDQNERILLLQRFIDLFGRDKIDYLTADREFIGEIWWNFLIKNNIQFYIRIKENMQVQVPGKGLVTAFWLFNYLSFNTTHIYPKIVKIKDNYVYLAGMKYINQDGKREFLIVASFQKNENALGFYKQRWQIECMFKAFKTAGFNLENTHLKDYDRLNKLLMITAIAFSWAYKIGIYAHENIKTIKVKKHGRPEKSFFAYGLKIMAFSLLNGWCKNYQFIWTNFLSCT